MRSKRTTFALAQDYMSLCINENTVKSMPFEQLALLIESATTIQIVKALLDRFESRFLLYVPSGSSSPEDIDHLLKRLSSPRKRTPGKKSRVMENKGSARFPSSGAGKLSRYPVRAVLCAYMILGHPNAVFSEHGEREVALSRAAADLTRELEVLLKVILDSTKSVLMSKYPSPDVLFHDSENHKSSALPQSTPEKTFRNQLSIFDAVWRSYLYCFVVWKVKDARLLEDDLVRASCQLELSMMQTCKLTSEGKALNPSHDMRAIQKQVLIGVLSFFIGLFFCYSLYYGYKKYNTHPFFYFYCSCDE